MNLQSDFNFITRLKLTQVVSQLFSVLMLEEQGCHSALSTTLCARTSATGNLATARSASRNILLTYLMTIYNSDSVANLKGRNINASKSQRRQGANQTIRLLTTQRDSLNISLIGIHIARALGAIRHYTKQIVIQTKVQGAISASSFRAAQPSIST